MTRPTQWIWLVAFLLASARTVETQEPSWDVLQATIQALYQQKRFAEAVPVAEQAVAFAK